LVTSSAWAGGNLIVEGRAKDLINRGGEKISAEEIADPEVRELLTFTLERYGFTALVVVGRQDPVQHERPVAIVSGLPHWSHRVWSLSRIAPQNWGLLRLTVERNNAEALRGTGARPPQRCQSSGRASRPRRGPSTVPLRRCRWWDRGRRRL